MMTDGIRVDLKTKIAIKTETGLLRVKNCLVVVTRGYFIENLERMHRW